MSALDAGIITELGDTVRPAAKELRHYGSTEVMFDPAFASSRQC
jgi:hypothetical protein